MPALVNSNINSLTAQRNLTTSQMSLNTSIQRISSGLRINSAKDDAAGLAIAERFTSQIKGLNQAARNANDAISLSQTAEGAMKSAGDILQRVRELAVQSANASNTASDRQALQQEVGQLVSELDRIATSTQFNGQNILDGTFGTANYQVGANANQTIVATTANLRTSVYGNNQNQASSGQGTVGTSVAAATSAAANGVTAGTIGISGYLGTATVTTVLSETAKSIADKINLAVGSTGVAASARTEVQVGFGTTGSYQLTLRSNNAAGADVSISFGVTATSGADGLSGAIAAVNEQASKTGVTAALNSAGSGIILTNSTGNDIEIGTLAANVGSTTITKLNQTGGTVGAAVTIASGAASEVNMGGYLVLDSNKSFGITGSSTNAYNSTGATTTLKTVAALDITTFSNATDAIKTVDSALSFVNSERAKLGALQSRFESAVANLQVSSENLSASRSRIQDADFAAETANLSRSQILQQAGTAMVAQANQLPQGVLALLR